MFLIRTNFHFFFLARSSPMVYSANLVDSLFWAICSDNCCEQPPPRSRADLEKQPRRKHPKSFCGNPEAAIQYDSLLGVLLAKFHQMFRLLFQKCSAAGRRLLTIVWADGPKEWVNKIRGVDHWRRARKKKGENWVAWFSGFQKSPFFFSSFFESAAGGFKYTKTIQNVRRWETISEP